MTKLLLWSQSLKVLWKEETTLIFPVTGYKWLRCRDCFCRQTTSSDDICPGKESAGESEQVFFCLRTETCQSQGRDVGAMASNELTDTRH